MSFSMLSQTEKDVQLCKDVIDNILQKTVVWERESITENVDLTSDQIKALRTGLEIMEIKASTYLDLNSTEAYQCFIAIVPLNSTICNQYSYGKEFYVLIGSALTYCITHKGEKVEYRNNTNLNPK